MKTRPLMVLFCIFVAAIFALFVMLYQSHARAKALIQVNDHAEVIANSLWSFEKSSPNAYLKLAAKANGYQRIAVKDDRGGIFLDIDGPPPTTVDKVFLSTSLIPVHQLESIIAFEGRNIGTISATWPCRAVYLYMYVLYVCSVLCALALDGCLALPEAVGFQ